MSLSLKKCKEETKVAAKIQYTCTRTGGLECFSYTPNFSLASFAPLTRLATFCIATSRAKSGPLCLGFSSVENGENPKTQRRNSGSAGCSRENNMKTCLPQSSVAPSWSLGMYFAAVTSASHTCSGVSTTGLRGLMTPINATYIRSEV